MPAKTLDAEIFKEAFRERGLPSKKQVVELRKWLESAGYPYPRKRGWYGEGLAEVVRLRRLQRKS